MAEAFDILLDENRDLLIKDGDFVIGPSDETHIEHIILSKQGTWRQFPALGVGILEELKGSVTQSNRNAIEKKIRLQLTYDGYKVRKLNAESLENVQIDAIRK